MPQRLWAEVRFYGGVFVVTYLAALAVKLLLFS